MRARNIKPAFFKNEDLGENDPYVRLLFIGLWCMADREGLLEYRLKRLAVEVFPYDNPEITRQLEKWIDTLGTLKLVEFWTNGSGEKLYIEIVNFKKHQHPHKNEKASEIKPLLNNQEITRLIQ